MQKISYSNKEDIVLLPNVEVKNKVTAADMNQIKSAVNANADSLQEVSDNLNITTKSITSMQKNINDNKTEAKNNLDNLKNSTDEKFRNINDTTSNLNNRITKLNEDFTLSNIPVGTILSWVGKTFPSNFMRLDGSAISRSTYSKLFSIIGETYGSGDGYTTFNLPNENSNPYGVTENYIPAYTYIIRVL